LWLFLTLAGAVSAQDEASLELREAALDETAVAGLHAAADALEEHKQHARALQLRRVIWMDYDEDDARARERTGFVKVGRSWRVDEAAVVMDRDLTAKKSKLRKAERALDKLNKQLVEEHRELAVAWAALDRPARAARHWRRVLAMAPGDRRASEALAIQEFEGFTGTADELRMLRRGRALFLACDWLNRAEFEVELLPDARLPLLEAAGLAHAGVRSEHFHVLSLIHI